MGSAVSQGTLVNRSGPRCSFAVVVRRAVTQSAAPGAGAVPPRRRHYGLTMPSTSRSISVATCTYAGFALTEGHQQ